MTAFSVRGRLLASIAVAVLALGVVACGSDDDTSGGDSAAAKSADTAPSDAQPTSGSPDEQQIEAVFGDMRTAIADSNAEEVCRLMGSEAKAQVIQTVPQGGCVAAFDKLFKSGDISEDLKPTFVSARVSGDRAIVKAKPSDSKQLQQATFVKEDGVWKVNLWLTD